MNTVTATIETLTAEVRVLQVGNRQITLSAARQLDYAKSFEDIEPFGRVRIDNEGAGDWVTVIGRCRDTGALTLATVNDPAKWTGPGPQREPSRTHWLAMVESARRNWPAASTLPLIVLAGLR